MLNEKNSVPAELVDEMMSKAKFQSYTFFGNCTVLAAQFPNGYVIVESSGCIDPKNYSLKIGKELCMERIKSRLWQLLGWEGANEFAEKQDLFPEVKPEVKKAVKEEPKKPTPVKPVAKKVATAKKTAAKAKTTKAEK